MVRTSKPAADITAGGQFRSAPGSPLEHPLRGFMAAEIGDNATRNPDPTVSERVGNPTGSTARRLAPETPK
jgi:hypothetical protein